MRKTSKFFHFCSKINSVKNYSYTVNIWKRNHVKIFFFLIFNSSRILLSAFDPKFDLPNKNFISKNLQISVIFLAFIILAHHNIDPRHMWACQLTFCIRCLNAAGLLFIFSWQLNVELGYIIYIYTKLHIIIQSKRWSIVISRQWRTDVFIYSAKKREKK